MRPAPASLMPMRLWQRRPERHLTTSATGLEWPVALSHILAPFFGPTRSGSFLEPVESIDAGAGARPRSRRQWSYKRSRISMSTRMAAGVSTKTTRVASRRITIFSTLPLPLPFPLFPAR
jgi:hypothetical protein